MQGGYKLDSQKMNRIILDRLKGANIGEEGESSHSRATESKQNKSVSNNSKTPLNIDINMVDKEVVYSKYEVNLFGTQQLKPNLRVEHYSQKENIPIPGRLPLSDIASLLGSNMDFSET